MATDQNLINALDAIISKANTAASTATPEALVYLAKAMASVGPASTTRYIVEIGESERARVIAQGNVAVAAATAGLAAINTANSASAANINTLLIAANNSLTTTVATSGSLGGIRSCQVFSSDGTWTKPSSEIRRIRVQLVGGGGGSAGHGENGGAGGYSEKIIDVTNVSSVGITIGLGGARANWGSNASPGGSTSFGGYLSASGGGGGHHNSHYGGTGGIGAGGDINLRGGGGFGHTGHSSSGAPSYFGGGPPGAHHAIGDHNSSGDAHGAPGSGGCGQWSSHNNRTSTGARGIVIVWEHGIK